MNSNNHPYKSIYKKKPIKFIVGILLLFLVNATKGQVAFEWANSLGGYTTNEHIHSLATDEFGYVYATGQFRGTLDFDPTLGVHNITAVGNTDYFLLKLDPLGNLIWVKTMGSATNRVASKKIRIDKDNNLIIWGEFNGIVDFDLNAGVHNVSAIDQDFFIQKLDTNGNLIWVKTFGGVAIYPHTAGDLTVDKLGNIYSTGSFFNSVDFDPGPSTNYLNSNGGEDIFILKLDFNGDFVWAKTLGGVNEDYGISIGTDSLGFVYTMGSFRDTVDFNPDTSIYNLIVNTIWYDSFILKLDPQGNFVWAAKVAEEIGANDMKTDPSGNIYTIGNFGITTDFDPNAGTYNLTPIGWGDAFIQKLDAQGNLLWAKNFGGVSWDSPLALVLDSAYNIYTTGHFDDLADFDPDTTSAHYLTSNGQWDAYIQKLDAQGNFLWARNIGGLTNDKGTCIAVDNHSNVYTSGLFVNTANFETENGTSFMTSLGNNNSYIHKIREQGITGRIYHDFNLNCIQDSLEINLVNRGLIINPGNIITTTNNNGVWIVDSLPLGNYTVTIDTSGSWQPTCPITQTFTVSNNNSITYAPNFGLVSSDPCPKPNVSIHAPFLRPGFSNQLVYVQVSNQVTATSSLDSIDVIVELDTLLTVQSISLPYVNLGNNKYKISLDTLFPGGHINFTISCLVSTNAILGQTICVSAKLFSVDSCVLDTLSNPYPPGQTSPCILPWDKSSLSIEGHCINDSIRFIIYNQGIYGNGDMTCFAPVRLYIDGQFIWSDSIQLVGEDSIEYAFSGDGKTWRMEVNQHPLHPGNSTPNVTIELCGNISNWTSNLVNILPHDDNDPIIDIYCGLITGSFDPNDKTGYPLGITNSNDILSNQELEYLIRFQNTGTDTAFTVVIRDTLSADLDIFSVQTSHSSHNYSFRMYGSRILEWTFHNIMLPDSTTNEPASHGFLKFKVKQVPDLPLGTIITNTAFIYFDFNSPVITNTTQHQIGLAQNLNWVGQQTLNFAACTSYVYNNITYDNSGTYWQIINNSGLDSLYTLNISILETASSISENACYSYTAPDNQVYTTSGQYTAIIPNVAGCDSTITINLTIKNSSSETINSSSCNSYTAPDNQVYTTSGQYTAIIPNVAGCDSIITINLSIKNSSSTTINSSSCNSYTSPDNQVYTTSGQYTAIIPNTAGCDSIITINLSIKNSSSTTINPSSCTSYTAPDNQVYTTSGQYTAIIPNVAGCDSVIYINLTLYQIPSVFLNDTTCQSYYRAPDGHFLFATGQYTAIIPSYLGCDSTIIVNVLFNQNSSSVLNEYSCATYTAPDGQIYDTSGQYFATIPNVSNCDSTITINLTLDNLTDSSVNQNGFTLTANAFGFSYQWLDCNTGNTPINGAINQSYTAVSNGNYAVQITNGTCTITSNCINITGLGDNSLKENGSIYIYPNPTTAILFLSKDDNHEINIDIIDNLGRVLLSKTSKKYLTKINMNHFPSGIYYLSINNSKQIVTQKIVKK